MLRKYYLVKSHYLERIILMRLQKIIDLIVDHVDSCHSYPYSVTEAETDKPASTWTHWPDIACTPKNVISIGRVRLSHVSLRMNATTMEGSRNLLIVFTLMFSAYVVYGQDITSRDRAQKICKLCLLSIFEFFSNLSIQLQLLIIRSDFC